MCDLSVAPGSQWQDTLGVNSLPIWLGHLRHYFCPADSGQLSVLENTDINVAMLYAGIGRLIVMGKVHEEQAAVSELVDEQMHVKRRPLCSAFGRVESA